MVNKRAAGIDASDLNNLGGADPTLRKPAPLDATMCFKELSLFPELRLPDGLSPLVYRT